MKHRFMIRIGFIFVFLCLFLQFGIAQSSIKTVKTYSYQTDFLFSDEWQYLSTDMYLFNAAKFSNLVNDLQQTKKKNTIWKKVDRDIIEYLLITANIKDVRYFGGDLTYPIYNFQASYLNKEGYRVHVDETDEVIRIFDNLPLHPQRAVIDGTIHGEIITRNNKDRILNIIADQLIGLSELSSPTVASLALIRELGRFMKSSTAKNVYRFNSTIRLYEGQDFSKRFYSIDLYSFMPGHKRNLNIQTDALHKFFVTDNNPTISRELLQELIDYHPYPFFAVVNYKSRYVSEDLVADEINSETIQSHRQKIKRKFEEGTIPSKSTYLNELRLLDFLENYIEFKTRVNTYRLNEKNQITQDISRILFLVAESYAGLHSEFNNRELEFSKDPGYQNNFRDKYLNILQKAKVNLELNGPLKNIKSINNCLLEHEDKQVNSFHLSSLESHLEILYGLKISENEENSELGRKILKLIDQIEADIFRRDYSSDLLLIRHEDDMELAGQLRDVIVSKTSASYCRKCKAEAKKEIDALTIRINLLKQQQMAIKITKLRKEANEIIYFASYKEHCVGQVLDELYPVESEAPKHIQLLFETTRNLVVKRHILEQLLQIRYQQTQTIQAENEIQEYEILIRDIKEGYQNLCPKLTELCICDMHR